MSDGPSFEQEEHPVWEGAIVGFLAVAESGLLPEDESREQVAILVIVEIQQAGWLNNLGELQRYLKRHSAPLQLTAVPFSAYQLPTGVEPRDPITGELKGYCLVVSFDTEATQQYRAHAQLSDEMNEQLLTHDTGIMHSRLVGLIM
jgi:hypothetical protein